MSVSEAFGGEARCRLHSAERAVGTCFRCLDNLCGACLSWELGRTLCPRCAPIVLRRAAAARLLSWTLLGGLLVALGTYALGRGGHTNAYGVEGTLDDYGAYGSELSDLAEQLTREPCERSWTEAYVRALIDAGDARAAVGTAAAILGRCGEHERLRWAAFEGFRRLSDWDAAEAEATALLALDPSDKDYWWWRAQVRELGGDLDGAVSDYRQALVIAPALEQVPMWLSNVLDRLGRPCDALLPVEQYLHFHPGERSTPAVAERLRRLYGAGGCDRGTGEAVLAMPTGANLVLAEVSINGAPPRPFVLDTGASITVVGEQYASELGLDLQGAAQLVVHTAAGLTTARHHMADKVTLQGLSASRVPIVVVENVPEGAAGLLGLSFLSRFDIQMEPGAGRVRIRPRAAP